MTRTEPTTRTRSLRFGPRDEVDVNPLAGVGRILGRKIETTQETIRADKPGAHALKLSGAGGAKATLEQTFTEAGRGTDTTVDVEYDLPIGLFAGVAEKLLGGSVERDLRHSMENFKALCEATVPAHV